MMFEIVHVDSDYKPMRIEADSRNKAKYKNFLDWSDAFNCNSFKEYLMGLISCRKVKDGDAQ